MIQLQHEYKKIVENYNCDIQEFITVQDPPVPPSNILHLSPLTSLHSGTTCNMELPQSEEPRKVQPPSQRTVSRQLMRRCPLWKTNIDNLPQIHKPKCQSLCNTGYYSHRFVCEVFHTFNVCYVQRCQNVDMSSDIRHRTRPI